MRPLPPPPPHTPAHSLALIPGQAVDDASHLVPHAVHIVNEAGHGLIGLVVRLGKDTEHKVGAEEGDLWRGGGDHNSRLE